MSGGPQAVAGPARARQLALPLAWRAAQGRRDFLVSVCNAEAVAAVDAWRRWPGGRMALVGPARSGKSHLAAVWAAEAGARVLSAEGMAAADPDALATGPLAVEDVPILADTSDPAAGEASLFHLLNLAAERGLPVLLTGREAPAHWPVALPDLASRLSAMAVARLGAPDDAALAAVLVKLAADRRLEMPPQVVRYLAARIERSFAAAERAVAALDAAALASRRAVTLALAADILRADGPGTERDAP